MTVLSRLEAALNGHSQDRADADQPTRPQSSDGEELRLALLEIKDKVLTQLANGADMAATLAELADDIGKITKASYCAVTTVNAEEEQFCSIFGHGLPAPYCDAVEGLDIDLGASPCAAAIRLGEPVVAADLEADKIYRWFRNLALPLGIQGCWSQPILDHNRTPVGTIALLHTEPKAPDDDDLYVMEAMCAPALVAIEHGRRAEALESADVRFASLAASIPGVVYQRVVSPDGDIRYTYISDGAKDLFGVDPEEIISNPAALFARHAPEYSETFRERLLTASRELTMWDVEASIISTQGEHKWTHAIARPHRRPDGAVVWDGIILDATRIKQAHMELAANNKGKTEFLANMSHELRTPLNAIIGFAEIMRDELLGELGNPTYKEYVVDIYTSGKHLLEIINDILDIAKVEAGKLELKESEVDITKMIENCFALAQSRATASDLTIDIRMSPELPKLVGDERKLKQILTNLFSNAIKFSLKGGQILITAKMAGNSLEISVADNGIGIAPENLNSVFEPFSQVDSGLDRTFDGAGLGLPLTKAMVELHDGSIEMKSKQDVGTTVTVRFPEHRLLRGGSH